MLGLNILQHFTGFTVKRSFIIIRLTIVTANTILFSWCIFFQKHALDQYNTLQLDGH